MRPSNVLLTIAAVLVLGGVAYAAEQDRAGLDTDVAADLADSSNITAAELRDIFTDIIDSAFNLTDDDISDIGTITATDAEVNYLDISVLGTGAASKAVVLDAGDDYTWPAAGILTYGVLKDPAATTITATGAEINYSDLTTLGTLAASKVWSSDSSLDTIMPTGGLLTIQSGGGLTLNSGSVLVVEGVTVNKQQLSLPGRATITICGDGTTINNNTVYYGPSMVPVAGAGRTCDITQVGNTTEATADDLAFDNTAFQVLSMDCLTADPGAAGVSFTLRSAEGATVPSVTCSVANTKLGCTANVQTTTAIAAGATLAVAAASTGDQGTTPFACNIEVAY